MKVLLADPPRKKARYDASYPSLGLLYLFSYLRENFKDAPLEILYLDSNHDMIEHIHKVEQFKPDIYGITITYFTSELVFKTIDKVKDSFPELKVVCGGPHATSSYEEVFEKSKADVCVIGEGEQTFLDLVNYFAGKNNKRLDDIDGISYIEGGGTRVTRKRTPILDLDSIPFPAFDQIDFNQYTGMHYHKASPQANLCISRGCPYNCVFCSNPVWKVNKPWLRLRSPENIAREVYELYELGAREIYFMSDEINPKLDWAIDVCKEVAKIKLHDLYIQCNIRADKVNHELAQALKEANCWLVHLGIESANDRVLSGIGKHVTVQQIETACRILEKVGINIFAFVMLYQIWEENEALCWETPEEVKNTLRFLKKLSSERLIDYMSWHIAIPMPGSRMYQIAEKYGLLYDNIKDDGWKVFLDLPGISKRTIKNGLRKGMLLKILMAMKTGNISINHLWRLWDNIKWAK